ncbi:MULTISPECIES: hypothetical protein [unclassified Pseudomonas]|uniref:hypothetical protein n=1 Tax=unclassified Pseudomonas TaxID=196821 RepID=UPI0011A3611C|nr:MULTISPECIES: hypothetical protein [unclassified Pseudomonas]TWC22875.1 hypothetical protein FBY00_101103 [Pseudomonas sp. SJZ075]TWC38245.1 hypothetical protein FBY02_101272 [Pseudomonas sp. SJZ078]TWC58835.1 hypothetical protein FBY11_101272 [Pseudomonas sp. SJZ124]TWC94300.1 hypothetical protein FBY09_101163 [Pseudomonas sp. SJZ101]
MPDGPFNRTYQLFADHEPAEAVRLLRVGLPDQTKPVFSQGYQLMPFERDDAAGQSGPADRVLASLGLDLRYLGAEQATVVDDTCLIISVAARLGLLTRMLGMSWTHLSARRSFGVKTTQHQLIKAEFADVSSQCSLLMLQWEMRIAAQDFQDAEQDQWQITQLANRAEKLMGGHGYLLGATHTLSYLSMMIYSLHGKTTRHYTLPRHASVGEAL